jgi:hypothetical protein
MNDYCGKGAQQQPPLPELSKHLLNIVFLG